MALFWQNCFFQVLVPQDVSQIWARFYTRSVGKSGENFPGENFDWDGFKSDKEAFSLETRAFTTIKMAVDSAFLSAIEKMTMKAAIHSAIVLATNSAGLSELPVRYRAVVVGCRDVFGLSRQIQPCQQNWRFLLATQSRVNRKSGDYISDWNDNVGPRVKRLFW